DFVAMELRQISKNHRFAGVIVFSAQHAPLQERFQNIPHLQLLMQPITLGGLRKVVDKLLQSRVPAGDAPHHKYS
ncbi:MAG: hypothetical protein WD065_05930, partial [Planctomycetaceae bacterium]